MATAGRLGANHGRRLPSHPLGLREARTTITLGNRQATALIARSGAKELADAAQLASLADETSEGR